MGSHDLQPTKVRPWIETPLIESSILSRAAGCRIFLKLENLQPSGSFKSRGLGHVVEHYVLAAQRSPDFDPDDLHFFSSSGGNAGLACVTAAKAFGIKSTIVVPLTTPQSVILKMRAAGATEVIRHGEAFAFADKHLTEVVIPAAKQRGEKPIYIHPYNDPLLYDGYANIPAELARQMPDNARPDAIICSVGGGGLFSGIMLGLDQQGWSDSIKVIACETNGAESLNKALDAGELITLPAITSIAKSLGASQVSERCFEQGKRSHVQSVVLQDAEAAEACWRFADDERIVVEPACGVSVALAYRGRLKKLLKGLTPENKVVIVVCGGSVVNLADMARWKDEFAGQLPADLNSEVPSALET